MCELCKEIASTDEQFREFRLAGKEEFIFDNDYRPGTFGICVETEDSYIPGILHKVLYCPRCGRKLVEE